MFLICWMNTGVTDSRISQGGNSQETPRLQLKKLFECSECKQSPAWCLLLALGASDRGVFMLQMSTVLL